MSESPVGWLSEVVFVLSAPLFAPRVRVVALFFEDFRHGSDPIGVIAAIFSLVAHNSCSVRRSVANCPYVVPLTNEKRHHTRRCRFFK